MPKNKHTTNYIINKAVSLIGIASLLALTLISFSSQSFSQGIENATSTKSTPDVVHIMKSSTNSYDIVDQAGLVSGFDTSYMIVGSSSSLNNSKGLITNMVQRDFDRSPTVGYVIATNITDPKGPSASAANPFVDVQTINSTIAKMISNEIDTIKTLNYTTVTLKCDMDMKIADWDCDTHGILK